MFGPKLKLAISQNNKELKTKNKYKASI